MRVSTGMKSTGQFEEKVKNTIQKHGLVDEKDKIIVACSGGKDSTTTLHLLNKFGYNVEALIIDLLIGDWSKRNLQNVEGFCEERGIRLHVINMRKEFGCSICYVRSGIQSKVELGNCAICGVIKRWLLNKKARELGATKLATGHNLDDEAETFLMTLFKGKPEIILGAGPRNGIVKDDKFVERIKPLYFCTNDDVKEYSKAMNFPVLYDPCPCSIGTFRIRIRKLLADLETQNPEIKMNIVRNFLDLLPALRENHRPDKGVKSCRICQEPGRNDVCKRCELMKILFS